MAAGAWLASLVVIMVTFGDHQRASGMKAEYSAQFYNSLKVSSPESWYDLLESTGYPDHAWQRVNPNQPQQVNYKFYVPSGSHRTTNSMTCVREGPVALAKNGVALFNALTGAFDGSKDAVKSERFDSCDGHTAPMGFYHYHKLPGCVYKGTADEFVGMAFDGHPVYGPNVTDMNRLIKSSDLDECHGRFVNGEYRYHITLDFPYIIGCYRGKVIPQSQLLRQPTTCTNQKGSGELCACSIGSVKECDVAPVGSVCVDKQGNFRHKK